MIEDVTGVLIAGGKSRRMGQDKRFLKVDGRSLIDRTVDVLEKVFTSIVIAFAEPLEHWNARGHRVVFDALPDCGSLGGLYTGLVASPRPWIFAVACDMPFLNPAVVRYMAGLDDGSDIVAAKLVSGHQPMHAFYSRRCVPIFERMAKQRRLKIQDVFSHPDLRVKIVPESELTALDPKLLSFRNINTPEDFDSAAALLRNPFER
ncbi:MAG TPA: molybdenum cofactor guanylyltransferase [Nitrospiraceae bacterium]|nr:molybdenum cofactor guanylyltransferase [Nitrospiraceae bacterium]